MKEDKSYKKLLWNNQEGKIRSEAEDDCKGTVSILSDLPMTMLANDTWRLKKYSWTL